MTNDLVLICKSKVTLTFNKPVYLSMCKLDLSKVIMYEFHYDYIKSNYGSNSRLSLTDSDNLTYVIKTKDLYEDSSEDKKLFDFSNYSDASKYYDDQHKLVICKMKDETAGAAIEKFVGLKPKSIGFW